MELIEAYQPKLESPKSIQEVVSKIVGPHSSTGLSLKPVVMVSISSNVDYFGSELSYFRIEEPFIFYTADS